jgi:hypothetical protein
LSTFNSTSSQSGSDASLTTCRSCAHPFTANEPHSAVRRPVERRTAGGRITRRVTDRWIPPGIRKTAAANVPASHRASVARIASPPTIAPRVPKSTAVVSAP